ncbi:restriction endonuclease [Flagellimonas algicola]|uniref:Restriction endonuclease n=1 Tax=Flagellimonas algicola TaxID=2583815 RepID=A0ABY2WJS9_9FLAO|nr:restriction endonuclease [Allomuricauda algicola]TMU54811.1 restriction endonuclease [Allomuricauda algicola]
MPRKGRKLELLVKFLESIELPGNATVTSPDYIEDKDTGQPREVDISIRCKVGTIPLLIVLECRDRKAIQGTPWVEEVIGKVNSINADKAVLISSSGFSEPAKKKAKLNGLVLRNFEDINQEDVASWFKAEVMTLTYKRYELTKVSIDLYKGEEISDEDKENMKQYLTASPIDKIYRTNPTGELVSLNNIFWNSIPENFFDSISVGKENWDFKNFKFNFTNRSSCYQLVADGRHIDIKTITLNTYCWRDLMEIPVSRLFKYTKEDGVILYDGVEFKLDIDGFTKKLVIANVEDEAKQYRIIASKIIDHP